MNKDIIKSAASLAVIIILAVIIVNANKFTREGGETGAGESQELINDGSKDYGECFDKDPSTVVFLYSNSCPHCSSMKPIVSELIKEGYSFYMAEGSNAEAREIISRCLSSLVNGYVPQFICPATGKERTGAMSKAELKGFADSCI
ncbi:hypothetical protein KY358_00130 [Candidatus Woesearchaeota archaeon]|nr:hypothetical protein [Candidatus Woesearchaeota archaeon]